MLFFLQMLAKNPSKLKSFYVSKLKKGGITPERRGLGSLPFRSGELLIFSLKPISVKPTFWTPGTPRKVFLSKRLLALEKP